MPDLSPQGVADLVKERWWQLFPPHAVDPVTLGWPVDPAALEGARVRWPRKYNWEPRWIWGSQVVAALQRYVPVDRVDLEQPWERVINFEVVIGGKAYPVNVETSDYPELHEEAASAAALHFKMEYSLDGYPGWDVLPGGYINADKVIYHYLPRLRRIRDEVSAERYQVYGRYSLSMDKRKVPLEILQGSSRFDFYGGRGKVRYSRYLEESARSAICIDLPSMASITFRCMDLFGIGSCIVGPPHTCQVLAPFREDVHVTYCKPDYSDLEEVCVGLLEDPERRRELIRNSRAFFDAYIHRDQLGSYYLHHCLDRLG